LVAVAHAAPQLQQLDSLDGEPEPFNDNPQYSYAYQVADDNAQTYIAHEEKRDGAEVEGQYSYVDPLGNLVVVTYTAGPLGYKETREIQSGFVQIRAQPVRAPAPVPVPKPVAAPAAPRKPAPTPRPTPAPAPVVEENDDDLVARIIAQLTPFISQTVSTSLSSTRSQSRDAVPATPARRPVPTRRVVVPEPVAAPVPVRTVVQAEPAVPASSSVRGIFGTGGANNVQVTTPDFDFAYDLRQ